MEPRDPGFTLIEILLVVAIIAIISSIGVLALRDQRMLAAKAACTANTSSLDSAITLYRFKQGIPVSDLAVLIPDYLREIPTCPLGDPYQIDFNGEIIYHNH